MYCMTKLPSCIISMVPGTSKSVFVSGLDPPLTPQEEILSAKEKETQRKQPLTKTAKYQPVFKENETIFLKFLLKTPNFYPCLFGLSFLLQVSPKFK